MSAVKKRIRPLVPSYKKVYSPYQYDWDKYASIYKKIQELAIKLNNPQIYHRVNPYRVLDLCYLFDENGNRQDLGDEKHIFRYKTLEKVRRAIAKELLETHNLCTDVSVLKYLYKRTGIVLEMQNTHAWAELANIWELPIKERLTINLRILKNLRKGLEIEEAVKKSLAV